MGRDPRGPWSPAHGSTQHHPKPKAALPSPSPPQGGTRSRQSAQRRGSEHPWGSAGHLCPELMHSWSHFGGFMMSCGIICQKNPTLGTQSPAWGTQAAPSQAGLPAWQCGCTQHPGRDCSFHGNARMPLQRIRCWQDEKQGWGRR